MSRFLIWSCIAAATALAAGSALAADARLGKQKAATCAVCHGIDGLHKVPDAPNLAGNSAEYLVKQLKAFRAGVRQHEQMSIIARGLGDRDMENLAAWYAGIDVTVKLPE